MLNPQKTLLQEALRIAETKQFGKGPWNWSGFEEKADKKVVDSSGEVYLIKDVGLADCPGWKIVSLYSPRSIYGNINLFVGKAGYVAISLCLLFVGAVIVLYVMAQRDITERKRSEDALVESEERYRAVFENAGIGINWLDQDAKSIGANQALSNMLGYSIEEFKQLTFSDITHPDDREISRNNLQALMAGDINSYKLEKRYLIPILFLNCNFQVFKVGHRAKSFWVVL